MTSLEFAEKAKAVANLKTMYAYGGIGQVASDMNKKGLATLYADNDRAAFWAFKDGFYFDCICLVKSILWGFSGDLTKVYGGAKYLSNGVPDITVKQMFERCTEVCTDLSQVPIGAAVFYGTSHIGIYVGNNQVVQSNLYLDHDGVYIEPLNNISWTSWGKLPYVEYTEVDDPPIEIDKELQDIRELYQTLKKFFEGR